MIRVIRFLVWRCCSPSDLHDVAGPMVLLNETSLYHSFRTSRFQTSSLSAIAPIRHSISPTGVYQGACSTLFLIDQLENCVDHQPSRSPRFPSLKKFQLCLQKRMACSGFESWHAWINQKRLASNKVYDNMIYHCCCGPTVLWLIGNRRRRWSMLRLVAFIETHFLFGRTKVELEILLTQITLPVFTSSSLRCGKDIHNSSHLERSTDRLLVKHFAQFRIMMGRYVLKISQHTLSALDICWENANKFMHGSRVATEDVCSLLFF